MENRDRSKLKDQVCHFLKTKGPGAQEKALTIAKGIGLTTASEVNPTLYDLEKSGQLNRTQNTPPLWSLKESQVLRAESLSHDSLPAGSQMKTEIRTGNMDRNSLEEQVCLYLKKKGPAAKEVALTIAKGVGLKTAKEINPTLYKLVKSGQLARTEDTPYYWSLKGVAGESLSHDSTLDGLALMTQKVLKLDGQDRLQSQDNYMNGSENGTDTSIDSQYNSTPLKRNVPYNAQDTNSAFRSLEEFSDVEKLGCGGYGCVFKAKHNIDGKHYAVKIVKYTGVEEKNEVEVLSKLEHPNIVRYHTSWIGPGYSHGPTDSSSTNQNLGTSSGITFEKVHCSGPSSVSDTPYGDEEDQEDLSGSSGYDASMSAQQSIATASTCLYMKMELCDGDSLKEWFRSKGKSRSKEDALAVFRQVVQGVEYVHSKGLIHRDLKPENILFGANDTVKIGDFGLVTLITDENGAPIMRTKGRGTETYRSPEQENNSRYNEKTDIFPLGLILFELLWKMETETERAKIWSRVRTRKLPPEFSTEFSQEHQLICMLLSEAPQERPSATEIGERLKSPV